MLETISDWMWSKVLTSLVVEYSLFQPICEVLHFLGLAMLVGVVGMLDLRMLGLGKGVSIAAIHRLLPWALVGFGLCAITGYIFVAGDPFKSPMQFFDNLAFQLKINSFRGVDSLQLNLLDFRASTGS